MDRISDVLQAMTSQSDDYLSIPSLIEVNRFLTENENDPVQNLKDTGFKYKLFEVHSELFLKREFNWDKSASSSDVNMLRKMTKMKDLTILNPQFKSRKYNYYIENMVSPKYFQKAFPLSLIKEYLSRPNNMYGKPIYDQSLRLQCDLLQIFFKFHLQADFKFQAKIDGNNVKIIDPLTRINIRNATQSNQYIKDKYFTDSFNLKKFVFELFENFFPNVTWRYIGSGHFAHRITLQITEYLFQIGMWTYEDHETLIKILLEKSENLVTLQSACLNDMPRLGMTTCDEFDVLFTDIKEYMSLILIHIIILANDTSLKESLSFTTTGNKLFKSKNKKEKLMNSYYKDRELNHIVMNILVKVLNESRFTNCTDAQLKQAQNYPFINSQIESNISTLFMLISSIDQDEFNISCKLVKEEHIEYYTTHTNTELNSLKKEMYEIKQNLVNLVEDLMNGYFYPKDTKNFL